MPAEMAGDLAFFGASHDALPQWMREDAEADFEVYLRNVPAYELWERMFTQWRVAGFGDELGLDYNTAFSIMDRMQVDLDDQLELLDRLRLIESGYISEMSRKRRHQKRNKRNR